MMHRNLNIFEEHLVQAMYFDSSGCLVRFGAGFLPSSISIKKIPIIFRNLKKSNFCSETCWWKSIRLSSVNVDGDFTNKVFFKRNFFIELQKFGFFRKFYSWESRITKNILAHKRNNIKNTFEVKIRFYGRAKLSLDIGVHQKCLLTLSFMYSLFICCIYT